MLSSSEASPGCVCVYAKIVYTNLPLVRKRLCKIRVLRQERPLETEAAILSSCLKRALLQVWLV